MKLFCLTKQRYMRRDMLADEYGRMWHLPMELAKRGHDISGVCASYHGTPAVEAQALRFPGGMLEWRSQTIRPYSPVSWLQFTRSVLSRAQRFRPDVVVAFSDAYQLIVGAWLAHRLGVPFVADFYDNYESYGASAVPGVRYAMRRAARSAKLVICVSEPLRRYVLKKYGIAGACMVIENGVDQGFLVPIDRMEARRKFALPIDAALIGSAGALDEAHGVGALYVAFSRLAETNERAWLVTAGASDSPHFNHPRRIHLGVLEHQAMPYFWRALDVGVVCVLDDLFGRYCFPAKAAEIAAVGTPMVVPRVGIFSDDGERWGRVAATMDADAIHQEIEAQLMEPKPPSRPAMSWSDLAERFDSRIAELVRFRA